MEKVVVSRVDLLDMVKDNYDAENVRVATMKSLSELIPSRDFHEKNEINVMDEKSFSDALNKVLELDLAETVVGECDELDEDFFDFFSKNNTSFLIHVVENVAEDTNYLGEVFGVGDDTSGYYYLLSKNENFEEICEQKDFNRIGLIVPSEVLINILDGRMELQGYDFCGAYIDGQWQFYRCNDRMSFMTFSTFGLITNLFSRNKGLFESCEMLDKYAIIIGCGSVGSHVALQLARAGVRKFIIIDGDVLKLHNVCRHQLGFRDLGRYKTSALKDAILNINPLAEVVCFNGYLQDAPMEIFNLNQNGIMVGTADNRGGNAFANDLALYLGIPFVAIGCWARAAAGEVFYWKPNSDMPTYREAYRDLISEERPEEHNNYFGDEAEQALLNFEPGTSIDIEFVSNIGIKVCLDLINANSNNYTVRVVNYLTNITLICNTNNPLIGGESVTMFPHPLFISNTVHMRKKVDNNDRHVANSGSNETMGEN